MTTIVFVEKKNKVEIAYDSKVSAGYRHSELEQHKVFTVGPVTFGVAGALGFANHVANLDINDLPLSLDAKGTDKWVQNVLIPKLKTAGKNYSPAASNYGYVEGAVLAAVNHRVYDIGSDFAWVRNMSGVYAIGSGSSYALGALHAGKSAREAVEAAANYDMATGHSIKVMEA